MVTDFDRLIKPRAIAIVGASEKRDSIGEHPLRFLTTYGFQGDVFPVNPKYTEMGGRDCYPNLRSLPRTPDIALIAVAARFVPGVIDECNAIGVPFAIVLSAGFREAGESGAEAEQALKKALVPGGVRLIGPNCIGMLNVKDRIHCGFGGTMSNPKLTPGPLAMVTHSGGWGTGTVDACDLQGIGFNYVVSTGNETDINALELIPYFLQQDDIEAVVAFLEGTMDGRQLRLIGDEALQREKPVILWKIGESDAGRRAVASHTGRLTADSTLFRLAVDNGGFIEIGDTEDLIDIARLLRYGKKPRGERVAAMSFSGGTGVLMGDLCEQNGLQVPVASAGLQKKIRDAGMPFVAAGNPMDMTPQIYMNGFDLHGQLMRDVLDSGEFDQLIARSAPEPRSSAWARQFVELDESTDIPMIVTWGSGAERAGGPAAILDERNIPYFASVRRAVRAMAALTHFRLKAEAAAQATKRPKAKQEPMVSLDLPLGANTLSEHQSKACLEAYGVRSVQEKLLQLEDIEKAGDLGLSFPLAVKIDSPDIPHKTEADCVRLGIGDAEALRRAAREVMANAKRYNVKARINGLLMQEMATGLEVIVGAVNDPNYGPVVMIGLGGIFAEVMQDVRHRFAPITPVEAHAMIGELKGAKLFEGYRGSPPLDLDSLADALSRVSRLIADHEDRIAEIDINPIFVRPAGQGVIAADALLVLKEGTPEQSGEPRKVAHG